LIGQVHNVTSLWRREYIRHTYTDVI